MLTYMENAIGKLAVSMLERIKAIKTTLSIYNILCFQLQAD